MHRKTGSIDVIDSLHKLGYGVSCTETLFIEKNGPNGQRHNQLLHPQTLK